MVYRFKPGARLKASPQTVGKVCSQLEQDGKLSPEELVEVSRDEEAPLHDLFEWDDAIAGEKYRVYQAGYIIRSVEVVYESKEPVRAFVPRFIKHEQSTYQSISVAIKHKDTREYLLESARKEMQAFVRKYRNLEELSDLINSIKQSSLFDDLEVLQAS